MLHRCHQQEEGREGIPHVGEGVAAPVRETAAMAIAAASKAMLSDRVSQLVSTVSTLFKLEFADKWEVRHGGLHAIRYVLAVRDDLASELVPATFEDLSIALGDEDDDVRAAAAAALQPTAASMVKLVPGKVPPLISALWDSTLVLEDISASTGHMLTLVINP